MNLFENAAELKDMLAALERRNDGVAHELLRRIETQRVAAAELPKKFSAALSHRGYTAAREMLPMVMTNFATADRLEVLLLSQECDFTKAAIRAQRSTSNRRFKTFWDEFDELILRRTHRKAEDVYKAVAARIPHPHPKPSVAAKRYGKLMQERIS
jgi:hypothetical protein